MLRVLVIGIVILLCIKYSQSAVQKNALKSVKFPKTDDGIPYYNPPRATKLPASVYANTFLKVEITFNF